MGLKVSWAKYKTSEIEVRESSSISHSVSLGDLVNKNNAK